jgi:hypothetical protein
MFTSIKNILQRVIRGGKPVDIVNNASNLLRDFLDDDGSREPIATALRDAAERTVSEIWFNGSLINLLAINATASIREAGQVAQGFADQLSTDKDPAMAMMADAYSVIAVLCYGRLGTYEGTDTQPIFEMASYLFGAVSDLARSRPDTRGHLKNGAA